MAILDIHTHHEAPQPEGVISLSIASPSQAFEPAAGQFYSLGIHPWDTLREVREEDWKRLEEYAAQPEVVAIGECGVDLTPKGGPLFRQLQVLKRHIELSERLGKPLVLHDVKAHDILLGLRRDMKPTQNWAIHGFRGKPSVATMLLRQGLWLSFGPLFNPATLASMPPDRILAETDESPESIEDVIRKISVAADRDMSGVIAANSNVFLNLK